MHFSTNRCQMHLESTDSQHVRRAHCRNTHFKWKQQWRWHTQTGPIIDMDMRGHQFITQAEWSLSMSDVSIKCLIQTTVRSTVQSGAETQQDVAMVMLNDERQGFSWERPKPRYFHNVRKWRLCVGMFVENIPYINNLHRLFIFLYRKNKILKNKHLFIYFVMSDSLDIQFYFMEKELPRLRQGPSHESLLYFIALNETE